MMETLRQNAYATQLLGSMHELLRTMDWKLWETLKVLNPAIDGGAVAPEVPVEPDLDIEDEEFKVVDGKLVKR